MRRLEAADSAEARARVEQFALYLHYLRLQAAFLNARLDRERVRALRELVEFGWRIVPTNMANTAPLIDRFLKQRARSLGISGRTIDLWKSEREFRPSEIRALLLEKRP